MRRFIEKILPLIVYICFILAALYLFALSINSTCYHYFGEERFYVSDSAVKHLLVITAVLAGISVCSYCKMKRPAILKLPVGVTKLLYPVMILVAGGFMLWFLLNTQPVPPVYEDQMVLCNIAQGLEDYDFSMFLKGQYLDVAYNQQRGMILFLWGFFRIFGRGNLLAFQLMNVVCGMLGIYFITEILCFSWQSDAVAEGSGLFRSFPLTGDESDDSEPDDGVPRWWVALGVSLFVPFLLYVTYVYGTVPGFTCMLGALYFQQLFFRSPGIPYLMITAVLAALGVWFKMNYLIMVIAMMILFISDWVISRRRMVIAAAVAVPVTILTLTSVTDAAIQHRIGMDLPAGAPSIGWMTMSFGKNDKGYPAGYDGYVDDRFIELGSDKDAAGRQELEDLKERLSVLTADPSTFLDFMGKKIAMNWNEPTFESVHINSNMASYGVAPSETIKAFIRPDNTTAYATYANLYHSVILFGVLLYCIIMAGRFSLKDMPLALCFVGYFAFSLFWENGSRYMLAPFMLLIPYGAAGYWWMTERLQMIGKSSLLSPMWFTQKGNRRDCLPVIAPLALIVLLALGAAKSPLLFRIADDDGEYTALLEETREKEAPFEAIIPDGIYHNIMSVSDPGISLLDQLGEDPDQGITIYHEYDYYILRLQKNGVPLSVDIGEDGSKRLGLDGDDMMFHMEKTPEGTILITHGDTPMGMIG